MYTSDSRETVQMFAGVQGRGLFDDMHQGLASQEAAWPIRPVNEVVSWLKRHDSSLVVADMGCGAAVIAQSVPNTVHSFDFVALNPCVVECDMRSTPLSDGSVDVVVFCLSLMGTNLGEFIAEARRVVRAGGTMIIAEVSSRLVGCDFVEAVQERGFVLRCEKPMTDYFKWFEFGVCAPSRVQREVALKPCVYKRR